MRLSPSGTATSAPGCHPLPLSHASSTPFVRTKVCALLQCQELFAAQAVGCFLLREALLPITQLTALRQHSLPRVPARRDSPAAVQQKSLLHVCDGGLMCCPQSPEGVEPWHSPGVAGRGQSLRARAGRGGCFPGSRRTVVLCLSFEMCAGGTQESPCCFLPVLDHQA